MSYEQSNSIVAGSQRARRRKLFWGLLWAGVALVVGVGLAVWGWWRYSFPYGYSHSCSKGLGLSLRMYAQGNDGMLPCGGPTPEASLSLLLKDDPSAKGLMRGKHLSQKIVDEALARDGILGPESCGWHYVEGLCKGDDPQIAVIWDKVAGLSHNGQRRSGLMHEVVLLDGSMQYVSRARWPKFVAEQRRLIATVMAARGTNDPPVRWSDEEVLGINVSKPRVKIGIQNSFGTNTTTKKL